MSELMRIHIKGGKIVNRIEEPYVEEETQSESDWEDKAPKKVPNKYVKKNHLEDQIIGNKNDRVQIRRRMRTMNK